MDFNDRDENQNNFNHLNNGSINLFGDPQSANPAMSSGVYNDINMDNMNNASIMSHQYGDFRPALPLYNSNNNENNVGQAYITSYVMDDHKGYVNNHGHVMNGLPSYSHALQNSVQQETATSHDSKWLMMYNMLLAYIEKNGHCRITVNSDVSADCLGSMEAPELLANNSVDSSGGTRPMYPCAIANGIENHSNECYNMPVLQHDYDNKHLRKNACIRLGFWLSTQRQKYRSKTLRPERLLKLQELVDRGVMDWGDEKVVSDEQRWCFYYNTLCEYGELHGHCNIQERASVTLDANGHIISSSGTKGSDSITRDVVGAGENENNSEFQMRAHLNTVANSNADDDMIRCAPEENAGTSTGTELVANETAKFHVSEGECDAGGGDVTVRRHVLKLGKWLDGQRLKRRRGLLRSDREAKLQSLVDSGKLRWSFVGVEESKWRMCFDAFVSYCKEVAGIESSDIEIVAPADFEPIRIVSQKLEVVLEDGSKCKIGQWLAQQQRKKKEGCLSAEKKALFDNLVNKGLFAWSTASKVRKVSDRWSMAYDALLAYAEQNSGNTSNNQQLNAISENDTDGCSLADADLDAYPASRVHITVDNTKPNVILGSCNVPRNYVTQLSDGTTLKLGYWLHSQRHLFAQKKLKSERYEKIQALIQQGRLPPIKAVFTSERSCANADVSAHHKRPRIEQSGIDGLNSSPQNPLDSLQNLPLYYNPGSNTDAGSNDGLDVNAYSAVVGQVAGVNHMAQGPGLELGSSLGLELNSEAQMLKYNNNGVEAMNHTHTMYLNDESGHGATSSLTHLRTMDQLQQSVHASHTGGPMGHTNYYNNDSYLEPGADSTEYSNSSHANNTDDSGELDIHENNDHIRHDSNAIDGYIQSTSNAGFRYDYQ